MRAMVDAIEEGVFQAEQGASGATHAVQRLARGSPTSTAAALFFGGGALVCILGMVVPPLAQAYVERVRALPAMQAWYRAAEAETEVIPQFEPYAAAP